MTAALDIPANQAVIWSPAPGFQTKALSSGADETLIGGSKGSGKSDVLVVRPLAQIEKARFKALITRESFPEMQEIISRAHRLYPQANPHVAWNGETRTYTFPSGGRVTFGFLSSVEDCTRYQGGEWSEWNHDELGNVADERIVDTMLAELRSPDPTIRRSFMASANPGGAGHPWLKKRYVTPTEKGEKIAWARLTLTRPDGSQFSEWRSRAFVPGTVWDNPTYANDAKYLATLMALPLRQRKYLLDGSWDDPQGVAFDMLDASRHVVRPFAVPSYWRYCAAFDWGIAHPAVCVVAAVDEDGALWITDTIWMVGQSDAKMAATLLERVPLDRLAGPIYAGHDVFAESRKYETVQSTADRFAESGIFLTHASLDRRQGYLAVATALEWRPDAELGIKEKEPAVRFFDTVGNRRLLAQLGACVMDPDDPGKVLKITNYRVDALPNDPDDVIPGDDGYDGLRYLIASRPMPTVMAPADLTAQSRMPLNPARSLPPFQSATTDNDGDPVDWGAYD